MLFRFNPILTFFVSAFILCTHNVSAQEAGLKLDFFGYADNRELGATYTTPKTIFGTIVSPQAYLKLDDHHQVVGGIHYNQDFGKHAQNKSRVNPIAYYNYSSPSIDFALGFIPRHERLQDVPRLVLADTLLYDRPNIEGMYFQYRKENMRQSVYIDWTSKQSQQHREQFVAGISGHYQWGVFYFANDGTLYHNALTSVDNPDEHIQDNAVFTAKVGLDFSEKTILDSLTIDAGAVYGFDRVRTEYEDSGVGLISNVHIGYKKFHLQNTLYLGKALNIPNGDPFYHRDKYNRLDLGWSPFKTDKIEGKFIASFHFREGGMDNQQAFTIRYNFGQSLWKK